MKENENKICVICNYFGRPPSYFKLWLESCGMNKSVHFLFITDIPIDTPPPNVTVIKSTLKELQSKFQSCFAFPIKYNQPWDFCAFKGVLGTIYKEELKSYDWWGWCDCDLIFGDLNFFLSDELLNSYDKILPLGHLSIIRNSDYINEFISNHPKTKQELMSSYDCFEEVALPVTILPQINVRQCPNKIPFFSPFPRQGHWVMDYTSSQSVTCALNLPKSCRLDNVYTWHQGKITGWFAQSSGDWVGKLPMAYCHFFRHDMKFLVSRLEAEKHYLIRPNLIEEYDGHALTAKEVRHYNRFRIHWSYWQGVGRTV